MRTKGEDKALSTISNALLAAVRAIRAENPALSYDAAVQKVQIMTDGALRFMTR